MPITRFPDVRTAPEDDIIAIGGDLHPKSLRLAYRNGIFPWPMHGLPLVWASPVERGILEFDRLTIPRTLRQARRRTTWRFSIDEAFEQVIRACASTPRADGLGTWITPPLERAFIRFHELGHAHSVEVWEGEELVGGLYGVETDGVFGGESMFHLRPNASKLALLYLIDYLRERGLDWIDIQTMTPHMEALGARAITREEFLDRLEEWREKGLKLFEREPT